MTGPRFVVVGIGADGWDGLTAAAQDALSGAETIYGSARQLGLIAGRVGAELQPWRSPMSGHLADLLAQPPAVGTVHLLASGDPMFHGLGASLIRRVGAERVSVLPAPSSASLAAARLGWDLAQTTVVSLVTAATETLLTELTDGARLLVLSKDGTGPGQIADLLRRHGFGGSTLTVLAGLGGPAESRTGGPADDYRDPSAPTPNIVAIEAHGPRCGRAPGRPDTEYASDGQLTKAQIRALTVCALAPAEGGLLWDVGAGSGSIGIEWLRLTRTGRAVAFEADPVRAERIAGNAAAHGVGDRLTVAGAAPDGFADAPAPDTVFIGGGLTAAVLDRCWTALGSGGRLVANAVTLQSQQLLAQAHHSHGGRLTRIALEHAAPLGGMTTWRPVLPIVQWEADTP
ncbi:precorrin-6y C5,15-methyltransferase (decarboxylating) subunit CbiE [Gordonia sp. VNK21]|uniref:precorrin-6y C5,15-methyltransferase (decarboxylating) subunit CbiE n=1 Tax=Gordonia sp. VNK21 TaxID=3382483 RepID=UPI0038D4DFED